MGRRDEAGGGAGRRTWMASVALAGVLGIASASAARAETPAQPLGEATCGKAGLPDCPLQHWMKGNLVAAKAAGDMAKLEVAFRKAATFAPTGSGWEKDWAALALSGAEAAKKGDKDTVAKTCTDCHAKFRKEYREKYRTSPIGG